MITSISSRFFLRVATAVLAVVALASASQVMASPSFHFDGSGREDPWNNCTGCHGDDLAGGFVGVACTDCHNDFSPPDPPQTGHHMAGRDEPLTNCTLCHGVDLTGDLGPSCFTCHEQMWPDPTENQPPNVVPGGPYSGVVGQPVQFDGSGTNDPDGDDLMYLWTYGDGTPPQFPGLDPTASHIYEDAGSYTALLTVTDGHNLPIVVSVAVEITEDVVVNLPPEVDPGGPYTGTVGQVVQFDQATASDPDGDLLTFLWDFGDGSPTSTPSHTPGTSHTYLAAGTYTVIIATSDGVNDPVILSTTVTIADVPGPTEGDSWDVRVPYLNAAMTVEFEDFAGVLFVTTTRPSGVTDFGIGMESGGIIFWMDITGAIYFGNIDRGAGTMRGLVFDYYGDSSIFFAERR